MRLTELVIFPFLLLAVSCGRGPGLEQVGRWQKFELSLSSGGWENPFTDVDFSAVFTSPSGVRLTVEGFHDGDGMGGTEGEVFKLRFAPSETGRWAFRTESNLDALNGVRGAFECVPSDERGPLFRDPRHPWYLMFTGKNEPFFESGPNDPEAFLARGFMSDRERMDAVDYLESVGCNILYFGLVNAGPGDGGPSMQVHPWIADSEGRPDFDTFCLDFMNRLERVLDRMSERGLIAHLVFYLDDCPGISDNITPEQEIRWFRYMVARLASYPGIIWNLAEEYEECFTESWCEERAALLKRIDPLQRPVTVHVLTKDYFPFAGSPNFDLTAMQFNWFAPDSINAMIRGVRTQTMEEGRPLPVSLIEWNPISPDQADIARRGIWAVATGGGTYQIFNKAETTTLPYDFALWDAHWRYARILRELMESLPITRMHPDNRLVSRGFCLAETGQTYLVYLPEGGQTSLSLPRTAREYHAYWIDPRTGERSGSRVSLAGGSAFNSPGEGDWALLVTVHPME